MNEGMQNQQWLPAIDEKLCTGCGDCVAACPTDVLSLVNGKAAVTNPERCDYCGACETICPVNAILLPYQIVLEVRQTSEVFAKGTSPTAEVFSIIAPCQA